MSSIVGQRGLAYGGAYSATKFAQVGLAESLRAELLGTNVHVSVICPVSTETEFRDAMAREQGFAVSGHGPRQSADFVARAMVRCLKRPKRRGLSAPPVARARHPQRLAPGLCDRIIKRFGRQAASRRQPRATAGRRDERGAIAREFRTRHRPDDRARRRATPAAARSSSAAGSATGCSDATRRIRPRGLRPRRGSAQGRARRVRLGQHRRRELHRLQGRRTSTSRCRGANRRSDAAIAASR